MKKIKNTFLRNVAFFMLGLVIFSCQKDNIEEEIQQEEITQEKIRKLIKSKIPDAIFPTEKKRFNKLKEAKKTGNYMNFNTLDEFSKYLDKMSEYQQKKDVLTHEGILTGGGGQDNYVTDTDYVGAGWYRNIAYYKNDCVGSGLNSWISGLTLGLSYEHYDGNFSYHTYTSGDKEISATVYGRLDHVVFFEGWGTYFSQNQIWQTASMCQ